MKLKHKKFNYKKIHSASSETTTPLEYIEWFKLKKYILRFVKEFGLYNIYKNDIKKDIKCLHNINSFDEFIKLHNIALSRLLFPFFNTHAMGRNTLNMDGVGIRSA